MPVLARLLRDRGVVTERQLQEAIHHQVLYGGRLGTSLYELGFITEDRLQEALARVHGVPCLHVDAREIDPGSVTLVPKALAAKHKVFPYRLKGKTLFLLMVDPGDHAAVARIGYSLGYIVKPHVVTEFRMIQLLRDYYGVDEGWRYTDTHRRGPAPPRPDPAAGALQLDRASTRDDVASAFLSALGRHFRRTLFFIVREPWLIGWDGAGEGMDKALAASLRIPLDVPSVFQGVVRDRSVFLGRLPPGALEQGFLKSLRKRTASSAAIFPVALQGRAVNLVFGDGGAAATFKADMGEVMLLTQKVARAYARIIRKRIADARKQAASGVTGAAPTPPGARGSTH